ncbi:hypothetical protein C1646_687788 [Rhizophagus diaphanus]|nr:hypothetical protein C1646_687788 [Rhizophagus diaphanus] [Rhizophagus sp. MUCL 43196]
MKNKGAIESRKESMKILKSCPKIVLTQDQLNTCKHQYGNCAEYACWEMLCGREKIPARGRVIISMSILREASGRVESNGLGGSSYMLVDTFVDESVRRNIASSIRCDLPANSCDPEMLNHYYECVAEFGFNHIIVIGEMLYGLLFLDCYGRVFQWENMEQVLWPMGDSLEDSKSHEDLVVWTVEDGVVYEESKDSLEPRDVKGTKNKRSKKKKKR